MLLQQYHSGRIEYVDKLKGFAIILVVMGHIIEKSFGIVDTPINLFYESFHMPLFMFLSGIFAIKDFKEWNVSESIIFLKKKVLRILLPFFVIGALLSYTVSDNVYMIWNGQNGMLWFLPALFYCMIAEMVIGMLLSKLWFMKSFLLDILFHFLTFGFHVRNIYPLAFGYTILSEFYQVIPILLYRDPLL